MAGTGATGVVSAGAEVVAGTEGTTGATGAEVVQSVQTETTEEVAGLVTVQPGVKG